MQSEIKRTLEILQNNGLIVYPTDTVWGIGCDASCEATVERVYSIKRRSESKSLIILVSDIEMLKEVVKEIPQKVLAYLSKTEKPTTVIYSNPIGLASNAVAADNTVAIRIVDNAFCKSLISDFGKPIISTSANISGSDTPKSFQEIEAVILESVDYVVDLHREVQSDKSSTIVKVEEDGKITVLRK